MGQAKQRGTFEERRASAVDRRARELALQQELMRRRPVRRVGEWVDLGASA